MRHVSMQLRGRPLLALAGLFRGAAAAGGGLDGQRASAAHLARTRFSSRVRTRTSSSPHSTRTLAVAATAARQTHGTTISQRG